MKIKLLRQRFIIVFVVLFICSGGSYFLIKIHINYNKKIANEINALNAKNEQLKKNIETLRSGNNYAQFIDILKERLDPNAIFEKILLKNTLEELLQEIAHSFRIEDMNINIGEFKIIDVFSLYNWKIEYTHSAISMKINFLLEEQALFFIKKIEDLFIKNEKLYNVIIDNIKMIHDDTHDHNDFDIDEADKTVEMSFDLYFFNVINSN